MLATYARLVANRPRFTLLAVAVVTVVMLGGAALTEPDEGGLESFVDADTDIGRTLEILDTQFADQGRNIAIQVVARGDVTAADSVAEVLDLTDEIVADPRIVDTLDTAQPVLTYASVIADITGDARPDQSAIDAALALDTGDDERAALLERLLVVDDNGDVTAAVGVINQQRGLASLDELNDAAAQISDVYASAHAADVTITTVSNASFDAALEDGIADTQILFPITLAAIVAVLLLFYRNIGDTLITLGGVIVTIIWSTGMGGFLGPNAAGIVGPAGIVATIIPVMLIGLSVDYALQILGHRREHVTSDGNQLATATSIRSAGSAVALGAFTTAVAFATNLTGPLPPLRDFGVLAAAGIISAVVVMTSFVPAVRVLVDQRRTRRDKHLDDRPIANGLAPAINAARATATASARHPVITLGATGAVAVGALVYGLGVSTDFSNSDFLPDNHPVTNDLELLRDELGGNRSTISIVIDGDLTTPDVTSNLEELDQLLRSEQLDDTITGNPTPGDVDNLTAISADGRVGLITAPVRIESPNQAQDLIDTINATWTTNDAQIAVTGDDILPTLISNEITRSQTLATAITIATALLLLIGYFWITDRRPLMGVIATIPVLGVLALVLATMRAVGIVYNPLTALLTSLTIGLGIDYTIHFTHRFLGERNSNDATTAIDRTVRNTGAALIASAATTVCGFAILALAPVGVISELGTLTAITVAAALTTTLTALPALLVLTARTRTPSPAESR